LKNRIVSGSSPKRLIFTLSWRNPPEQ
jgi:hypothetical protein